MPAGSSESVEIIHRPGTVVAAADEADKSGLSGKGKERASKQLACKHHVGCGICGHMCAVYIVYAV